MKRICYIIAAAMAMVSSIACSVVEIDNPSANQTPLVFTATFDATKANIDENGKFSWVAGDKINVINAEGTSEEVTLAEADIIDGVAKFTTKQLAASDTYYAVYPSVNYKSLSDGLLKVCPQTIQKVVNQKTCVSVCSGEEMNFCFHNTTCLIKFETELSFHHAVFTALGNEKIHSSFTVNPETGVESAVVGDQGNQVFCNSDGKTGPYFFELAPGVTMASGFSIELRDASETVLASYKNTSSITTARNKILNIKNFDSRIDGKYTVTLSDDAENPLSTVDGKVTLPTREGDDTYSFAGWSTTNIEEETTVEPTIIPAGSYSPQTDVTLYPVYSRSEAACFTLSLVYDNNTYYVGPIQKSYFDAVTSASDATSFYIEDNQYLYFYNGDTKTYVCITGDNTSLVFDTDKPHVTWNISTSSGSTTFITNATGNRSLAYNYNSGNPRFASYKAGKTYPNGFSKHDYAAVTYYISSIHGSVEQYTAIIKADNINKIGTGTGYADYNGEHNVTATASDGSTKKMTFTSSQVMPATGTNVGKMQFKASVGSILGTGWGTIVSIDAPDDLTVVYEGGNFSVSKTSKSAGYYDSITIVFSLN